MSRTMIQAAVTMNQLQNKMDVIGNNMANSQTTGYKSRQANFSSLLFQQMDNLSDPANAEGRLTPDGLRIGSGAKLGSINADFQVGSLRKTDRSLDTALLAPNLFFQVEATENGVTETRYTRDGAFYLSPINGNQEVMLVDKNGHAILGADGPIITAAGFDDISVQPNGQIVVKRGDDSEVVGTLAVVEALRPHLLEAAGENAFRLSEEANAQVAFADAIQPAAGGKMLESGKLEASNVNMSKEMSDLIMTQRAYQFNARTISTGDQMSGLINQLR
ncbi:flagellar hook-basal body protein [Virgibacillus dokdonensis]|uniref:Flagellar basal-body rod protein FlgG n=2 Tax=Virgibacillus TaxID=84406 RepID=A0A1M5UBL2_9BACI|nr:MULTISPECIES: flagellar hook-basal body protein [Virgibacillus]RFA36691.1 flagellar hook-basal body protein [Virgibacillus dokdonensis]SHH60359.1 flagellar basal-body rod protein FlgG [Virgibacillus chiguensis]